VSEVLPPEHFDPDRLLEDLVGGGVRFILIGGLAVGVHGVVRATRDLDVVPDPEPDNLARLADVLGSIHARQIGVDTEHLPHQPTDPAGLASGGSFQLATDHGQLDVLQESETIPAYESLAADALEIEWHGLRVQVCSLERLREMKVRAGRPIDLHDLQQLSEAHGDGG